VPEGRITALKIQKRKKDRVNVFIDDQFAFGLSLIEAAKLRKGQTLTEAEITRLRDKDAIQQAIDRAARFLAYRPRSTDEVRRNLSKKNIPPTVIDAALEQMSAQGYLDDRAFALFWIENRNAFKPLGSRALRYELRQKRVPDTIIDEVLDAYGVDDADAAYRAASQRARRLRNMTRRDFQNKVGSFLQRRGFAYNIARVAIERLMEELDEPGYFVAPDED
jgi:regulatory protein